MGMLEGKVAIVTGAGGGLGRSHALAMAAEGATVVVNDLEKAGSGVGARIVSSASEAGVIGNAGQANYSAAKAGILALTMVLCREMERSGVTVNAIAPRAVTRMTERLFAAFGDDAMKQLGPESASGLVTFLASDEAAHINGHAFVVCGGLIQLLQGWQAVAAIEKDDGWMLGDVRGRIGEPFQNAPAKLPSLG